MVRSPEHSPTIALVYDHVTTAYGGAEVVLDALHQLYPDAPLYTTVADTTVAAWAQGWQIQTSFLQKMPSSVRRRHQWQAFVAPIAVESLDLSAFDIIISVTAGAAKGVISHPNQLHISYVLTPTRYLYDDTLDTHTVLRLPLVHWLAKKTMQYLRWWDQAAAGRPDHLIAISKLVARRIKEQYQQKTTSVIYPPFRPRGSAAPPESTIPASFRQQYDLIISRLVWYKRVDIAISAARITKKRLIIVGSGSSQRRLIALADSAGLVKKPNESLTTFFSRAETCGATILFCGSLSDESTTTLLAHSRSLLMLGVEDFGMTALEALSLGKPVIIDQESGVAELLKKIPGCQLLTQPTAETVAAALNRLDTSSYSSALLKRTARWYSDSVFRQTFAAAVEQLWQHHKGAYEHTT